MANDNPILDSIIYEVEYLNGYVVTMAASVNSKNLFAQVYQEGNRFALIESIIDTRTGGTQTLQQDSFVVTKSGTKQRKNITKIWEVCIQWKDESTTWNKLKDITDLYPEQMVEYAVENIISEEPAFAW